jgi:hypothetical protein
MELPILVAVAVEILPWYMVVEVLKQVLELVLVGLELLFFHMLQHPNVLLEAL